SPRWIATVLSPMRSVPSPSRTNIASSFTHLEVVPANVSLGGLLGGGALDDEAVARLAALPGAAAAWPKQNLRVPVAASRAPEGLAVNWPPGLTVMIPGVGVPRGLVEADLAPGTRWDDPGATGAMPAVLSRRLLEVYNRTIAPSWNVRRLPPAGALVGLQMAVRVGFSIVPLKTEDRVYEARLLLAGLSDRTPTYAAALPLDLVRRLNREYGKRDDGYSAVALLAARPDDAPALGAAVRRMGFAVDEGERGLAERVGTAVAVTTGALALLALLMCALAGLAVAQALLASVRARTRDFALLEAVGAAPGDVRALLLVEGALTGLAGGVAGTLLARAAAAAADRALLRLVPELPFRPETLVAWPWWLWLLGPAVAGLAAVLGALAPAAAAARIDPARALS
ncbi:MAG TPA: ABC transporter permease, partial [Anaeromyxobacteraceae bacterium]|nr:ABC transporter permease [Anaeromyxobacteraceae bacterium]